MTKFDSLCQQYQKAVIKLNEALVEEKSDMARDSAIKRFEMVFDLAWKLAKEFLSAKKGIICNSPKECWRSAYQNGLLDYDELWLNMTDWRNEAVHTYNEQLAESLYSKLPEALERFKTLEHKINEIK